LLHGGIDVDVWLAYPLGYGLIVDWANPNVQASQGKEAQGSTSRPSASECVASFYNTAAGQAVQFLSPLSLAPAWNPNWGSNAADWAIAIGSKGGSLSYVGTGETLQTLNSAIDISSTLEGFVGGALGLAEKLAAPAMAMAASVDALAHGYCRAVEQGGLPTSPFGQ